MHPLSPWTARCVSSAFTAFPGPERDLRSRLWQRPSQPAWYRRRYRTQERLEQTTPVLARPWWNEMDYDGLWREQVVRSFLVLHLMIYRQDRRHRCCAHNQLARNLGRLTELGLPLFLASGHQPSASTYCTGSATSTAETATSIGCWNNASSVHRSDTRIVYGISPDSSLKEEVLEHLRRLRGLQAGADRQRCGRSHLQLDVFGEVII